MQLPLPLHLIRFGVQPKPLTIKPSLRLARARKLGTAIRQSDTRARESERAKARQAKQSKANSQPASQSAIIARLIGRMHCVKQAYVRGASDESEPKSIHVSMSEPLIALRRIVVACRPLVSTKRYRKATTRARESKPETDNTDRSASNLPSQPNGNQDPSRVT